ncbi:MAG: signal peptide peptidase SppA [Bacteroidota bacterium]
MKQFFKFFFASMLGFIVGSIVLTFLMIGILAAIVSSVSEPEKKEAASNSVLTLTLDYAIPEQTNFNPLANLNFSGMDMNVALGLNDILKLIKKAKTDNNIKGIYLDAGTFGSGISTAKQIRDALIDFKESKKFIVAFADAYSQKGYYVSSVADKIVLNPAGIVEWRGLNAQIMFFKGMLEKLGVEVQVFYDGRFKTATEPFRYDKMSPANKVMTLALLKDIQNNYVNAISASRNIDTATVNRISDSMLIRTAYQALSYHFIDEVGYSDAAKKFMSEKMKQDEKKKINFISMSKYSRTPDTEKKSLDQDKIAVVYAQGDIVDGQGDKDNIGGDKFAALFEKLRRDDKIKAIVFRVNSPGGSAVASDVIWREVSLTKAVKPVVVSMGDYAASGGYFISCSASKIVAQPTTLTGSIGVFAIIPCAQKLLNDKLGITFDHVGTGHFSDFGDLTRPFNDGEKVIIQNEVDSIYAQFKKRVYTGRNLDPVLVDSIAQGRVWTGTQGLAWGLVDTLGGIQDAINIAAKMVKSKNYRLVEYPTVDNKWTEIFSALQDAKDDEVKMQLGDFYSMFQQIKSVSELKGMQMRIPYSLEIN